MDHKKRMAAPIVITVIFVAYLAVYGFLIAEAAEFNPWIVLLGLPLIALGAGMIYVLITRIREIRSGEEDDLGNY